MPKGAPIYAFAEQRAGTLVLTTDTVDTDRLVIVLDDGGHDNALTLHWDDVVQLRDALSVWLDDGPEPSPADRCPICQRPRDAHDTRECNGFNARPA